MVRVMPQRNGGSALSAAIILAAGLKAEAERGQG